MTHLFAALAERAVATPDAVFCEFFSAGNQRTVTVAQVMQAGAGVAAALRKAGVAPGQVVPIVLEHRVELFSSFIGATLIGAVPAFLPPLTAKQDPAVFGRAMAALLARLHPVCVVGSAATRPVLGDLAMLDIDQTAAAAVLATPTAEAGTIAFLQHSSGTTGLKKGVQLTHGAVLAQIASYSQAVALVGGDVIASWLPLYHDMGLITAFLLPAVTGATFVSLDALEWTARPTMLLDMIERFRATLAWMPNFAFHHIPRLAQAGREWDLRSLRMLVNCSEPCRAAAFDLFAQRLAASGVGPKQLAACYALAENVFAVTQTLPGQPVARSGAYLSSGRPVAGVQVVIRDPDPATGVGGIHVGGAFLFDGYYDQPEQTASRLSNGWLTTGDLGFVADGELFVVGRDDDVLNINGRKVLAHEIEDALNTLPGLAPGRVLAYAELDAASGAARLNIAAELIADAVSESLAADIRRAVFGCCAMRPHSISLLASGSLVKSTSGKLARAASLEKLRGLATVRVDR